MVKYIFYFMGCVFLILGILLIKRKFIFKMHMVTAFLALIGLSLTIFGANFKELYYWILIFIFIAFIIYIRFAYYKNSYIIFGSNKKTVVNILEDYLHRENISYETVDNYYKLNFNNQLLELEITSNLDSVVLHFNNASSSLNIINEIKSELNKKYKKFSYSSIMYILFGIIIIAITYKGWLM